MPLRSAPPRPRVLAARPAYPRLAIALSTIALAGCPIYDALNSEPEPSGDPPAPYYDTGTESDAAPELDTAPESATDDAAVIDAAAETATDAPSEAAADTTPASPDDATSAPDAPPAD